ncbi:sensor domain-containing diguanylate cyclase [Hydrogenibacillus schlegelii]|uniref:GGDEF domain-containing protein n=1 Tax=Hydrogenibacillus schlegelii TaxID=1484 RepID=A0A132MG58_HYDSH|nr:sensor domain-containing diguanylate cyclase [Hydrogenibacillus schlegelii]KWW96755.1 hypothetical protein TR75_12300 [Hydrogenibacillus schlegelii]OAR05399.1 hypothetical protein SA87_10885 [Hydrogenibacillus schlegelii]
MTEWAMWLGRLREALSRLRRTGDASPLIEFGQALLRETAFEPTADGREGMREAFLPILSELHLIQEELDRLKAQNAVADEVFRLSLKLFRTFDPEAIYAEVHRTVARLIPADVFFVALVDRKRRVTVPYFVEGGRRYDPVTLWPGQGLVGLALREGRPFLFRRAEEIAGTPHLRWGEADSRIESALFVPLYYKDRAQAVVSVQSTRPAAYGEESIRLLEIIGGQMIAAVASAELFQEVERLSYYDELTGLKNRRAFERDLRAALRDAAAHPVALVMVDSDDLKRVNDRYGHSAGDRLLILIAELLRRMEDERVQAYRYGGDEFLLILRGFDRKGVTARLRELRRRLARATLLLEDGEHPLSVSIGAALFPDDARNLQELIRRADEALYASKTRGKNCATLYASDGGMPRMRPLALSEEGGVRVEDEGIGEHEGEKEGECGDSGS